MSANAATRLMHAVLDGEATPAEARELEGLLEADPALRERYGEWQAMFDAMQRMPRAYPPEGLVATIYYGRPGTPMPPWKQFMSEDEAAWIVDKLMTEFPK